MRKTIDIRIIRLMPISFMLFACLTLLCSCKKDYNKLATEFERQLPDTCVVLYEQINDIDHVVYYKNKSNTYLIRHDLEDNTEESIKPTLEEGQKVCGIFLGKNNIAFLVKDNTDWYYFWFYNLKTYKFKNIEGSFYGAYVNETNKTFSGNMDFDMGRSTIQFVYDFDGKEVSSNDISSGEPGEQATQTDDILNITQPTTFKYYYDGSPMFTYILYTDGTFLKRSRNSRESSGEWRLLEKSIHDEIFRAIVVLDSDKSFTWFTNDNICGYYVSLYNDFDDADELLMYIKKMHDIDINRGRKDTYFEVSYN